MNRLSAKATIIIEDLAHQLAEVRAAATEELRDGGTYADAQIYGRRCKLCRCWWPLDREPYHGTWCVFFGESE